MTSLWHGLHGEVDAHLSVFSCWYWGAYISLLALSWNVILKMLSFTVEHRIFSLVALLYRILHSPCRLFNQRKVFSAPFTAVPQCHPQNFCSNISEWYLITFLSISFTNIHTHTDTQVCHVLYIKEYLTRPFLLFTSCMTKTVHNNIYAFCVRSAGKSLEYEWTTIRPCFWSLVCCSWVSHFGGLKTSLGISFMAPLRRGHIHTHSSLLFHLHMVQSPSLIVYS